MLNFLPVAKLTAGLVTGMGVGKVFGDIIKNNVTVVTRFDVVKVYSASLVMGLMVAEQSQKFIDRTTDEMIEAVREFKNSKSEESAE